MKQSDYPQHIYYLVLFLSIICLMAVLKVASSVAMPVTVAILLSFALQPVVKAMNRIHIPWIIATILVSILMVLFISCLGFLLVASFRTILSEYPKYQSKFLAIYKLLADQFNLHFDADASFFDNIWVELNTQFDFKDAIEKFAVSLSGKVFSFGQNLFMVVLLIIFLLTEMRLTSEKLNAAFEGKLKTRVMTITSSVMTQVVRFIFIKFYISLATGVLVFVGIKLVGLDFAIVWGFIAFVMNFIPTFGSIFSVIITTLFSILQFYPHYGYTIYVFLLMLTINMVLGTFLEPRIEGKHLGISPFVILVSLSLWGWIWNFIGMILAVPFTVIIKIVCENVSFLHPVAVMLGGKPANTVCNFSSEDDPDVSAPNNSAADVK